MKKISDLRNLNNRWYDYPIKDGVKHTYKVGGPKPFKVYHEDGTFDLAYSFGDYQYTFSTEELAEKKAEYQKERAAICEHKALLRELDKLDTETLRKIVKAFCEEKED